MVNENIRTEILSDLEEYCDLFPEDKEITEEFIEFISSNENLFGRDNKVGHITCSAWIVTKDFRKALLNHHKTMGKWVQTGGHIDKGESPFEASFREAVEESGLENLLPVSDKIFKIGIFTFPPGKDGGEHIHFDIRYLFISDTENFLVSEESNALKWVSMDDLASYSNEDNILGMEERLEDFKKRFNLKVN